MLNKIMYTLANILMVVEVAALAFLVWSWNKAKKGGEQDHGQE